MLERVRRGDMGRGARKPASCRRDQVLGPDREACRERLITGSRKPAEPGREDDDDDDRPEEFGDCDTEIGANRDSVVEGSSVPERRGDAETDPDDAIRTKEAPVSIIERPIASMRSGPIGRFIRIDSPRLPLRKPPAQRRYCCQIGSVSPSLSSRARTCSGGAKGPQDQVRDISGQKRRDAEDEHRDRHEDEHHEKQAPRDITGHRCSFPFRVSARRPSTPATASAWSGSLRPSCSRRSRERPSRR